MLQEELVAKGKIIVIVIGLLMLTAMSSSANQPPTTIEIVAKRFSFVPDEITVQRGQTVTLALRTIDVAHGLIVKDLGLKAEIPKGKETIVTFTPEKTGTFIGKCSHFCGSGHGSMKFTVTVTE